MSPRRSPLESAVLDGASDQSSRLRTYERLLAEYRRPLLHYIFSLVLNEADAEDLVQRTSLVMWKKFDEFDPTRSFQAWANGIAFLEVQNFRRTIAAGRLRFNSDVVQGIADQFNALPDSDEKERMAALKACLQKLPDRDRQLLEEVYWDGRDYEAAARNCGMALQTAYNRMRILRVKLLECVSRRLPGQGRGE